MLSLRSNKSLKEKKNLKKTLTEKLKYALLKAKTLEKAIWSK